MRIGITYDLKPDSSPPFPTRKVGRGDGSGVPDDLDEEFDSPVTIDALADALRQLGHDVFKLGNGRRLLRQLLDAPPDFVFNMAEGQGVGRSREARVPAVLEMLGIPYTGSDPLTLAATLDKDCAKRLVASAGVAVPSSVTVDPKGKSIDQFALGELQFPVIVKPAWEGSSKGIRQACLVDQPESVADAINGLLADYSQPVLIEEYIAGDELTVGILGNDPPSVLGVMRVMPRRPCDRFVYSVEVKRDFRRQVNYECPPNLPAGVCSAVEAAALRCFGVLGCRDVARIDFRVREGVPYFLEANPLPGLNPESSDLVIMASLLGWKYPKLVQAIFQAALERSAVVSEPTLATIS
jgi:D-alanine-D-alanine ligase